jgi:hypothetical protein
MRQQAMRQMVGRLFMAWWWGLAAVAAALAGEPVSDADARAVRTVIEAQLAAFAADDAERAFSYAAPGIRETFGDAERFMTMVRRGYPVVYRPTSVRFLEPVAEGASLLQRVRMTDETGVAWMVVYELQRQADRSWRIAACVAARGDGITT